MSKVRMKSLVIAGILINHAGQVQVGLVIKIDTEA